MGRGKTKAGSNRVSAWRKRRVVVDWTFCKRWSRESPFEILCMMHDQLDMALEEAILERRTATLNARRHIIHLDPDKTEYLDALPDEEQADKGRNCVRKYNRVVAINLTEEQYEWVEKQAEDAGMKVGVWLRGLVAKAMETSGKPEETPIK